MGRTARRVGAAAIVIAALFAGGCSGSDDDHASSEGGATAVDDGAETSGGDAGDGAGGSGDLAAPGGENPLAVDTVAVSDRAVVRTGQVDLVVDDAEAAAEDIRREAERVEGFVAEERATADPAAVDITIRVPAAEFEGVRTAVAGLGEVTEQTVAAEDVTSEMVDVETRISSLRASVERLQGLLGGAGDVAQLAVVEGELARREVELEALLGQQRVLEDQVQLATLRVLLSEDRPGPSPSDDAPAFRDGLRTGWALAVDGAHVALAAVGFALPFMIVVVPAVLAFVVIRRRGRGQPG